jgi:hypothetical protein
MLAEAAAMMVMELQSIFPPSEVMDALSIVYPQFWIEPGHEDKLTCHMNTLKATFCVPKKISSTPLQYETSPALLDAAALDRQLHWFGVAMVNNSEHAMRALDLTVHPIMKVWRNFAQSGLLRGMFPVFFKLAKIAMIQVCFGWQL